MVRLGPSGATATEYSLLVARIALAIASIIGQVGTHIAGALDRVAATCKAVEAPRTAGMKDRLLQFGLDRQRRPSSTGSCLV